MENEEKTSQIEGKKDKMDLMTILEHSADKLAFLGYFFITTSDRLNNAGFEWSETDASGLGHVLEGIRDDLNLVIKEMQKLQVLNRG